MAVQVAQRAKVPLMSTTRFSKQKEKKITDIKILEISTEDVIKKIYEGGSV